ncbi:hypothetical protein BGW38_000708 [Lunasporangiospora selenospora]|uniref:BTB domain-containing protein n=1 Tax=Lunasporangiospora selenospora TaxID=979761 RepID=A0A9P6FVQ3_9FUNG|nr:hypothetical protein BGW38_000708 [Lunasporangiospora selenospora]
MIKFAKPCRTTGQNLVGLWRPSFTRVDQKLYLYGGGGHVTNDLHVLDLETMNWDCVHAKDGVPPTKRYGHTAVLWKDMIIIFGGANEDLQYRDDVIAFSLTSRTWFRPEIRGEVPARYLHSATVYKNRMFMVETLMGPEPYTVPARYNHSASLIGSKLWIYAGKDEEGQTVSDLHSIDLITLKVIPHSGITGKVVLLKSQHFSESIGNHLVVFGKYLNEATYTSLFGLWIMDLEQLEWRKLDIDHCLGDSVWNYFTIVSKKPQLRRAGEAPDPDLDDGNAAPKLVFLGNTEKDRPQPYDHFRDVLSINAEYLGIFQIPPSTLQSHMGMMLDNEEFSDFTINPKGSSRVIHVHRMVLSTRWPHFRNMHASGMIESTRRSIDLPEPYPVVYAFLTFLYTDKVNPELDYYVVCDVMIMANIYLLERLKKLCASILHQYHLQVDTCVRIFQAACVSQEYGLKKLSQEYIFRHCGAVMKTEDWMLMWTQGEGTSERTALEEFIDGIPEDASLEVTRGSRRSTDGYGAAYENSSSVEPSLRKDL